MDRSGQLAAMQEQIETLNYRIIVLTNLLGVTFGILRANRFITDEGLDCLFADMSKASAAASQFGPGFGVATGHLLVNLQRAVGQVTPIEPPSG